MHSTPNATANATLQLRRGGEQRGRDQLFPQATAETKMIAVC
jgi:hypothetical protein